MSTYARQKKNDSIKIKALNEYGVCNVRYRWFFGWSISNYGNMTIYKGDSRVSNPKYSQDEFKRVCAHEFGHILGVKDLYNKPQNIIDKYSYAGNYSMMGNQWLAPHINNYDLQKVLLAFMNNKSQGWT